MACGFRTHFVSSCADPATVEVIAETGGHEASTGSGNIGIRSVHGTAIASTENEM